MKVWTCKRFTGHWPVGSAAVMIAEDRERACVLLENELAMIGLPQTVDPREVLELDTEFAKAVVLVDGDY